LDEDAGQEESLDTYMEDVTEEPLISSMESPSIMACETSSGAELIVHDIPTSYLPTEPTEDTEGGKGVSAWKVDHWPPLTFILLLQSEAAVHIGAESGIEVEDEDEVSDSSSDLALVSITRLSALFRP
jgi:hypothetical protein